MCAVGRLSAGHGWWALIAGIVAWEVTCAEGELLSHGFDRLLERHPVWPRVAVLAVALHLINWLPERFDPFAVAFRFTRREGLRWKPLKPSFGTAN